MRGETTMSMTTGREEEAGMMTEGGEVTGKTGTETVTARDVMITIGTETGADTITVTLRLMSLIVTVALTCRERSQEVKIVTAVATGSRMSIVTKMTLRRSPD